MINSTTYQGDIILDCFAGSGSTGVAALELERKSILFEIEEKWSNYEADKMQSTEYFGRGKVGK